MNPETHEAALLAAYKKLPYRPGLHDIEPLIATYLREAGLVVAPNVATEEMIKAGYEWSGLPSQTWDDMLAAFKSPFGEP